jgi:hypothetical protein
VANHYKKFSGLKAMGAQTSLDLNVLTLDFMPTFTRPASVCRSIRPCGFAIMGLEDYSTNFSKDSHQDLAARGFGMPSVPLYCDCLQIYLDGLSVLCSDGH